jgi:N-methylhydantoinase B
MSDASMSPTATRVDPVTASVIRGALENIAIEMGYKLMRMSYSSIIRESEDFGAVLIDAQGNQLCETTQSTPLQSGPIPGYIRGMLRQIKARGETIEPGDVIMHNDPYGGASHGPDVAFVVPVFYRDDLIGFAVTTAHHLDIGALSPGSCGIVDAMDTYAEGLQFKAVRVYQRGQKVEPVWHMLRDNIRNSKLVVRDMEGQIAACRIGAQRYVELIERYGLETVNEAYADLLDYSERLMRAAIAELPDGDYRATTYIDGYLDDPDSRKKHLPIVVTLKVRGDELIVDLTGTAAQIDDKPINMPLEGTVDCARSILLDSERYGYIPQNSGLIRPITLHVPQGTLANPIFPAPTIARFCPGNQLADTVMKALSQVVPEKVAAGIGNLRVIAFSGLRAETHWVHMEIFEGAYGGRYGMDGMDSIDTLYANTRNNPIEDLESHLPLRIERYELRDDVCPAGQWRGGLGSIREFTFLEDGGASIEGEDHVFAPWGFAGGHDGATARLTLRKADGTEQAIPSKMPYRTASRGDTFIVIGPAGGGYGEPVKREPDRVLSDVLDGFLTREQARVDYAVVIRADLAIDHEATATLRGRAPHAGEPDAARDMPKQARLAMPLPG